MEWRCSRAAGLPRSLTLMRRRVLLGAPFPFATRWPVREGVNAQPRSLFPIWRVTDSVTISRKGCTDACTTERIHAD